MFAGTAATNVEAPPLPERCAVMREVRFRHGDVALALTLPLSADALIDEQAFAEDERLPYWADLWPSARALARHLVDSPASIDGDARIVELGCGAVALASVTLAVLGRRVLATDYEEEALASVQFNAAMIGAEAHGRLQTRLVDWRLAPQNLGQFDVVLAADVMYEQRHAIDLADFVPQLLAERGKFLLADPGRRYLPEFQSRMQRRGFIERDLALIEEPHDDPAKPSSHVRILEYRRVGA
jgi:predicted nicotinamide N-methyase